MSNNFCTFVGKIAKEPELQKTQAGVSYTKFFVILDGEKDGAWIQCQAWRDVAKKSLSLKTNDYVYVTSQYRTYSYKDRHGETAYGHNFKLDDVVKIATPPPPVEDSPLQDDPQYPF